MEVRRGIHGLKLEKAKSNKKVPSSDRKSIDQALQKYDQWIESINQIQVADGETFIRQAIPLLSHYKFYIDFDLIFNRESSFLYRQKGQLKLDNTIIEEFLPLLITRALELDGIDLSQVQINTQTKTFSSMRFMSNLGTEQSDLGMEIKTKDQDFAISKKLFMKLSQSENFDTGMIKKIDIGFIMAELKTNLDKTMFQEASATAKDVKATVPGSRFFLLAEFLDMPPISTLTTDIDEVLVLRKAKRLSAGVRSSFAKWEGRQDKLIFYKNFLLKHPYDIELFVRFYKNILAMFSNTMGDESEILNRGFF